MTYITFIFKGRVSDPLFAFEATPVIPEWTDPVLHVVETPTLLDPVLHVVETPTLLEPVLHVVETPT